jgi:predicted negative regulator of RcsB-dependent stress response
VEEYLSEKERWEWVKEQVRVNAPSVILAVVVALAGIAGWRWWQQHADGARIAAAGDYLQMVQALERGDRTEALVLLGQLERDHAGSPYTDQGKLLAARVYVDGNELDKAAAELAAVVEHSKDRELALVAQQRLARVQIAQGKPEAALETLKGTEVGAFAARYHEVRGDAFYAKGDKAAALGEYRAAQGAAASATSPLLDLKIADLAAAAPPSAKNDAAAVAGK